MNVTIDQLKHLQFGNQQLEMCISSDTQGGRKTERIYMDRRSVGLALEYNNPVVSIRAIHLAHREIIDPHSRKILFDHTRRAKARTAYTLRGVLEITRFSTKPKANQFMDWVWSVIEKFLRSETSDIRAEPARQLEEKSAQEAPAPVVIDAGSKIHEEFSAAVCKLQSAIGELLDDLKRLEEMKNEMVTSSGPAPGPVVETVHDMMAAAVATSDDEQTQAQAPISTKEEEKRLNIQAREMVDAIARKRNDCSIGYNSTLREIYHIIGIDSLNRIFSDYVARNNKIPQTKIESFDTFSSISILKDAIASLTRMDAEKQISIATQY